MKFKYILLYITFLFVFIIIFPGIYYEDMTDVYISVMSRGFFTSEPVAIFNNYGAHFLLAQLYVNLEKIYAIGWYGILNVLFMYLATINIFLCVYKSIKNKNTFIFYFINAGITALVLNDILFLQYTKTAIYLVFSSLWIITYNFRHNSKSKSGLFFIAYQFFLFTTGILLRQFSVVLILMIYMPVLSLALINYSGNHRKRLAVYLFLLFSISFTILYAATFPWNKTDKDYAAFVNYKISIWDNGQSENTILLKNETDSINYKCLSAYFIPEKKMCDPAYLKSLGIYKSHDLDDHIKSSFLQITTKISISNERWKELTGDYYTDSIFLLFILFPFIFKRRNQKTRILKVIWIFFCIEIISIIVKMEGRVLYPSLLILIIILMEETDWSAKRSNTVLSIFIIISSINIYYIISGKYYNIKNRQQGQDEIIQLISDIKKDNPAKIYVLDWVTINILENRVITFNKELNKLRWFTLDPGYLVFYTEYSLKQKQLTGTTKFEAFIEYAVHHKDQFTFIFSEDRILLIKKYYKTIYHKDIEFIFQKPLFTKGDIFNGHYGFYEYSIE